MEQRHLLRRASGKGTVALSVKEVKPVLLHHGWTGVGKGQLHLKVNVEADPRYMFQFEDEVALNPQVVQLHGRARQPIFSCKFVREVTRASQPDHLGGAPSSAGLRNRGKTEKLQKW